MTARKGGWLQPPAKVRLQTLMRVSPGHRRLCACEQVGGIRRLIVPPELGYPAGPNGLPDYNLGQGPRPSNFAGERALGFVLQNRGMIDKTLLFDIELLKVS